MGKESTAERGEVESRFGEDFGGAISRAGTVPSF